MKKKLLNTLQFQNLKTNRIKSKFNIFANFSALSNMALGAKKCTTNNLEDIIYVYCVIWFCIPPWRVLVIGPLGVFNLCSMYYEMSKLLHIFFFLGLLKFAPHIIRGYLWNVLTIFMSCISISIKKKSNLLHQLPNCMFLANQFQIIPV